MSPCVRGSDRGPAGSRGGSATAAAVRSGPRGAGRPGVPGLERRGRRVLPLPELGGRLPAEAAAER